MQQPALTHFFWGGLADPAPLPRTWHFAYQYQQQLVQLWNQYGTRPFSRLHMLGNLWSPQLMGTLGITPLKYNGDATPDTLETRNAEILDGWYRYYFSVSQGRRTIAVDGIVIELSAFPIQHVAADYNIYGCLPDYETNPWLLSSSRHLCAHVHRIGFKPATLDELRWIHEQVRSTSSVQTVTI